MATSGTTAFTTTRDELITDAMDVLHAALGKPSSSVTETEKTKAARALNMMLADWRKRGIGLWKNEEVTLTLVASTASYTLGPSDGSTTSPVTIPRPTRIVEARLAYSAGNETPLTEISRHEYMEISDKTAEGKPSQFYYDPQLGTGTLYLWPVPDSASDTVKFTALMPIEDIGDGDDNPDLPPEWFMTLKWNLISEIAPSYREYYLNEKTFAKIEARAAQTLRDSIESDRENTSVFFEAE